MALTPTSVYRGFPPSEDYNPDKGDIIALLTAIQTLAAGSAFAAVDVTLADLPNGTASGDLGLVLSEASDGGVYRWDGSAWVMIGALPFVVGGEAYAQLAQAWAESPTPPDPNDSSSKSSKTWAGESADSAATATTQAGNAATQAGNATTQAGNAATSAATATTQAGNAATSASEALTSATQAELAALAAGATLYDSTFNGLADTTDGDVFLVATEPGVQVYRNDAGSETFLGWLSEVLFDDVTTLLTDTSTYTAGTYVRTRAEGFAYKAVDSGGHVQNNATPPQEFEVSGLVITPEQFGAVGDGVTDDSAAMAAAFASGSWRGSPGASYRVTQNLVQGATGVIQFNGSKILIDVNVDNNLSYIAFASGSLVKDAHIELPTGADIKRWVKTADNVVIEGLTLIAADQIALGSDNLDAALYLEGDGVRVYRVRSEKIDRVATVVDDTSDFIIDQFDAYEYLQGVSLRGGTGDKGVLNGMRGHTLSANATTDPGHNLITGRHNNLIVSDVDVYVSGEHGLYIAHDTNKIDGLTLRNIRTHATGQCSVKLRNMENFSIEGLSGQDCAVNNATGTNEDILRLESCDNGVIKGLSGQKNVKAKCSHDVVFVDNCTNIKIIAPEADAPFRAFVRIEDSRGGSSNIVVRSPAGDGMATAPMLSVSGAGSNFSDIYVEYITAKDLTGSAIVVDVTGALAGPIRCTGSVWSTDPSVLDNVNGTANVTVRVDYNGNRDFYELGSWSPGYSADNDFSAISYDIQEGLYVRTGQLVVANGLVRTASLSGGSGRVYLSGLPYAAQNTTSNIQPVSVGYSTGFSGAHPSSGLVVNDNDVATLYYRSTSNGGSVQLNTSDMKTGAGNYMIISASYIV